MVALHYGLSPETVNSFLQDAKQAVPAVTRKVIGLLGGETAWRLTLGAGRPTP
jgi:hypothetical protein